MISTASVFDVDGAVTRNAQLVLAREYGFDGWQNLIAAVGIVSARVWSGP